MAKGVGTEQSMSSGDNSVLIQAGHDVVLPIVKAPPDVKLVRVSVEDAAEGECLRQKVNIVLKNNGDRTAVLLNGYLFSDGKATVQNCSELHTLYELVEADWQYDISIDDDAPTFVGRHSIAPNEVASFDVMVGQRQGGPQLTIYRIWIRLDFDEGGSLETERFHLRLLGPMAPMGSYTAKGPTPAEWGRCMEDNVRRLDEIGYDLRPQIDPEGARHIEAVAPGLMSRGDMSC